MELWVRSQQKTKLYKIDNINMDDNNYTLYYQLSWGIVELGQYNSKERALEVLDEIHRLINDLQYMSYAIPNNKFSSYRPNVYEMPED